MIETAMLLPSEPLLRGVAYVALVLAGLIVLVMLQVLLLSALSTRRQRRRKAFYALWRPQLALASIDDESCPLSPSPQGGYRLWWLMLWNRMQRQLRGAAVQRLNGLLRRHGLQDYALQLLQHRGVRGRLVALETLRYLADVAHWSSVQPLARHGNSFVSLAAAHALVAIDPDRAMRWLLPQAMGRNDWSSQRVAGLCQQAGPAAVTGPLLDALERAGPTQMPALVPLLACAEPAQVAPGARHCLEQDVTCDLAAALRVLAELGDPRDRPQLIAAFADIDPDVRLAAVQALRRLASAEDAEVLLPMLADPSWWVRQETADALVSLPRTSIEQVQALLPRVEDAYGRQALQRALATRGL